MPFIRGCDLMEDFAKILRDAREAANLTIQQFAQQVGCSEEDCLALEAGSTSVRADVFFRIVNTLNIPPEKVMPLLLAAGIHPDAGAMLGEPESFEIDLRAVGAGSSSKRG